ncbi:MAG: DUF2878 domain-containing protein [Pseudomonadota bacterium]
MIRLFLNFAGFQIVWWIAVLGAAAGQGSYGVAAAVTFAVLHFGLLRPPDGEHWLVAMTLLVGAMLDSSQFQLQLLQLPGPATANHAPVWLVSLWLALGLTLRHSLSWMERRPLLAGLLGLIAAPVAYHGGAALGALAPLELMSTVSVGLAYALALPALGWFSVWLRTNRRPLASPGAES